MKSKDNTLSFEIGFYIKSHLSNNQPEPLYRPSFIHFESEDDYDLATVETCLNNFDELVRYYESLFSAIKKHNLERPQEHIWLRPAIFYENEPVFTFPWFDRLSDAKGILTVVESSNEEYLYTAVEQSWYFAIMLEEEKLLFFDINDENDDEDFPYEEISELISKNQKYSYSFDQESYVGKSIAWEQRETMLNSMKLRITQAEKLIEKLRNHFNIDLWSDYNYIN